uniref:Uncharacterized protein n=2 Tax=Sphaerodactylus townsendi TaxID=933632 RepID=A0ACB8GE67_9SAUR
MVTRCIVEVLLNGLSKPNAPPINPLCKEFLKKSSQQKPEKKRVGQDIELDTRLSESKQLDRPPEGTEKEGLNADELKRLAKDDEKRHPEEGKQEGKDDQQIASQRSSYSYDEAHEEEKKNEGEKRNEEDGSYTRNHSEEGSREKKQNEEEEHEPLDKKSLSTVGRVAEDDYKHSVDLKLSEESVESQEQGNQESKEEEEEEEEKYHHSFHREYEDSYEEDAQAEKRDHKPRHNHRKTKVDKSTEYRRHHNGEKRDSPEELSEEEDDFWDKRSHWPKHYYNTGHRYEEKRNSEEMHDSEEMEGNSRSQEYLNKRHHSKEEEDTRAHSRESEEKPLYYERKKLHDEPQKGTRHHYEERKSHGGWDEKRHVGKKWQHLQMEEIPRSPTVDVDEGEQKFYRPEEEIREEKRHYPTVLEEELEKRRYSEGKKHGLNKRTFLVEEGYPRSHYLMQNVKRAAAASYIPYYQQLRWKNRHVDKKDDMADPFWESAEEPRSRLDERDFFPDYNDYELWGQKQLLDSLNHKHNENSRREKMHKFDMKREYSRMDELAHLLNNRKKSAELPELYHSSEDEKRGHMIRRNEGKLSQRPLTQEEEKELENLAAMDLELQKMAEKFNNNRQG